LIGRPVIESDAVRGDEDAGAVFTKFAMNENFARRSFAEEREEFGELSGSGSGEAANRKRNKVNAERFRLEPLPIAGVMRFAAEIDDGGDT